MSDLNIKGIKFISSFLDGSGYGKAARAVLKMIYSRGIPVQTRIISFEEEHQRPDLGQEGQNVIALAQTNVTPELNLVMLTPDMAEQFIEANSININWFFWEVAGIHPRWLESLNKFDAIFTSCEFAKQVLIDAGVTKPIFVVYVPMEFDAYLPKKEPNATDTYKFYSILQWQERKNPIGLIKAYYRAFSKQDDVLLVLKTYVTRMNVGKPLDQHQMIKDNIMQVRSSMQMQKEPPNIYLVTDVMKDTEILKMHTDCDCCVSIDRGEGYGLVPMAAMMSANPTILSNFSAYRDYATEETAYFVNGQLEPTFNLTPFYPGDICSFFNPNIIEAADQMRHVFENREEAFNKGKAARNYITDKFSEIKIFSNLMKSITQVVKAKKGL